MTSFGCQKFVTHWSSTESKAFLEQEDLSSKSEFSDYSQTLSETKGEEMEKEEDNNVQIIFSHIEPYKDKP